MGRYFDPDTGEELIHRDHRRGWESASAFGQIIWRIGPAKITAGDIDFYSVRWLTNGLLLLRIIEHKQPDQELKGMQRKVLSVLADMIHFFKSEAKHRIDQRSGVFILRGKISAETNGFKKTYFDGPTTVSEMINDKLIRRGVLDDAEAVFRWLEGTQGTSEPSGPRRHQSPPTPTPLFTKSEKSTLV